MRWNLELDKGISSDLRTAVRDEDYQGIVDTLKKAYQWIHDNYEDYDEDDLERDIEDLDSLYITDDFDDDYTLEDMRDEIDFELSEFWDLCDNLRIWVGLIDEAVEKKLTEADEGEEEVDTTFGDVDDIQLTGDVETDFKNVVDLLKKTSYDELGDALNDITKDPKLYNLLSKGFGDGELAKVKMSSSEIGVPVQSLFPTQNEIGLDNSLKWPLANGCANLFNGDTIKIKRPIITYRKTFIVDGHHRWSQLYMINPEAKISAINFNYEDSNPYRALRDMQGAIAVAQGEVPSSDSKGINLYNTSEQEIRKYIEDNITDTCVNDIVEAGKAKDKEGVIDYITKNALELKNRNVPFKDAPDRKDMPQTDEKSIETAQQGMTNI